MLRLEIKSRSEYELKGCVDCFSEWVFTYSSPAQIKHRLLNFAFLKITSPNDTPWIAPKNISVNCGSKTWGFELNFCFWQFKLSLSYVLKLLNIRILASLSQNYQFLIWMVGSAFDILVWGTWLLLLSSFAFWLCFCFTILPQSSWYPGRHVWIWQFTFFYLTSH